MRELNWFRASGGIGVVEGIVEGIVVLSCCWGAVGFRA
jgi:hypothetical protein